MALTKNISFLAAFIAVSERLVRSEGIKKQVQLVNRKSEMKHNASAMDFGNYVRRVANVS